MKPSWLLEVALIFKWERLALPILEVDRKLRRAFCLLDEMPFFLCAGVCQHAAAGGKGTRTFQSGARQSAQRHHHFSERPFRYGMHVSMGMQFSFYPPRLCSLRPRILRHYTQLHS